MQSKRCDRCGLLKSYTEFPIAIRYDSRVYTLVCKSCAQPDYKYRDRRSTIDSEPGPIPTTKKPLQSLIRDSRPFREQMRDKAEIVQVYPNRGLVAIDYTWKHRRCGWWFFHAWVSTYDSIPYESKVCEKCGLALGINKAWPEK